jgi:HPt (histidine-containing phosphotransfer) domain-containing protein
MSNLSWNKEFALEQAADDEELLKELIDIFKQSFSSDLSLIKEGLEKGDLQQIYGASHSIKGAAASLGIDGIKEIAFSIEIDAKNGSLKVASERVRDLDEMLQDLKKL